MPRHNLAWLVGIVSVSLLGFFVAHATPEAEKNPSYENVRLIVEVMEKVYAEHLKELNPEERREFVEAMLNGGLTHLDPHSSFIGKKQIQEFQEQNKGKFSGIGIHVSFEPRNPGQLEVLSPIPGSPAYKKGITAGDRILKVDDESTENMKFNDLIKKIKGPTNSEVTLKVLHQNGESETVKVKRADIRYENVRGDLRKKEKNKEVEWDYLLDKENRIGYVRLMGFSENATGEMKAAVQELKQLGVKGLILDLRYNGGGLLRGAIDITDLFISKGKVVSIRGRGRTDEVHYAKESTTILGPESNVPIVILINRNSASASEIFAAALKDHGRAVVMGERSFGKGSVQQIFLMEEKTTALKLTTATYWRPSNKNIHRDASKYSWNAEDKHDWGVRPNKELAMKKPLTPKEEYEYQIWRRDRDLFKPEKKDDKKEPFEDRLREHARQYLLSKLHDKA